MNEIERWYDMEYNEWARLERHKILNLTYPDDIWMNSLKVRSYKFLILVVVQAGMAG